VKDVHHHQNTVMLEGELSELNPEQKIKLLGVLTRSEA
jgi:hypothetical protein